jgi:hypothetical protein
MGFNLPSFLSSFQAEIDDLVERRFLNAESITDGSRNYQSKLHARMLGALARAVQRPLVPLIEVKWSQRFCPDLCVVDDVVDANERIVAVVEYESTNSSDERLEGKDLSHFEEAIIGNLEAKCPLPTHWIMISTLPDCSVTNWPWWAWNRLDCYLRKVKDRKLRNESPYRYYESGLRTACHSTWKRIVEYNKGPPMTNIAWVNLDANLQLAVKNLNGEPQA